MSLGDVRSLIERARAGDRSSIDQLLPLVYSELHSIAAGYLRRERPGHTLQPTALINEVYLRLIGGDVPNYADRAHFVGIAAYLMRQVLTEHARRRCAAKRGGDVTMVVLNDALDFSPERAATVVALDDALIRLAATNPEHARLVELRFFGGMTAEESALVTGASVHAVRHRLRVALAWLHREVNQTRAIA